MQTNRLKSFLSSSGIYFKNM